MLETHHRYYKRSITVMYLYIVSSKSSGTDLFYYTTGRRKRTSMGINSVDLYITSLQTCGFMPNLGNLA
uniref:Uncharacterized protein n=1 Tax=Octopus bimaculoides TaxID=37653 RepID=A0A0L8G3H5_OCTBM